MALDLTEEWNKVADTQLITSTAMVRKEYAEEHPDRLWPHSLPTTPRA